MINAGASHSLIKIEAVEIAMIPRVRKRKSEAMTLNVYQMEFLFKSNRFIPVKLTRFQKGDICYVFCSKGVKRTFQKKGGVQD